MIFCTIWFQFFWGCDIILNGLDVKVVGNHATLVSDGALAGSVTNLADCMRTVVKKMEIKNHLDKVHQIS